MSIGEFSRATGLTVKTLRFYHERGLLEPATIDPSSGYRYYDERNVDTASVIQSLRSLEFSLDDIGVMLAECGDDDDAVEHLERHRQSLREKLQHYEDLVQRIELVINSQREARKDEKMKNDSFPIEERVVEAQLAVGIRMRGKYSDCGEGFSQLAKQVGRYIAGKPLCLFYDGEYKEEDADFEPCFPVRKQVVADGAQVRTLPGGRFVTLLHRGPYDSLSRSYARIFEYAKQRRYDIALPTREVYVKGPGMIFRGNPQKYLTEIQLPIDEGPIVAE